MAEKTKIITSIGGQALMEGIMMRGPKITSVAVRKPDGEIHISERPTESLKDKYPIIIEQTIIQDYLLLSYHILRNFPTNIILYISF